MHYKWQKWIKWCFFVKCLLTFIASSPLSVPGSWMVFNVALGRFLIWQLAKKLKTNPIEVPFCQFRPAGAHFLLGITLGKTIWTTERMICNGLATAKTQQFCFLKKMS